jgi:hypothetical protein
MLPEYPAQPHPAHVASRNCSRTHAFQLGVPPGVVSSVTPVVVTAGSSIFGLVPLCVRHAGVLPRSPFTAPLPLSGQPQELHDNMTATPTDLCLVPAGLAPAGHQSNLIDPVSLAPTKIAVVSILVAWGIIFTSGRFYVNFQRLFLGDYFVLTSLIMSISILGIMSTQNKMDRHIWDTPACYFDGTYVVKVKPDLLNYGKLSHANHVC